MIGQKSESNIIGSKSESKSEKACFFCRIFGSFIVGVCPTKNRGQEADGMLVAGGIEIGRRKKPSFG